MLIQEQFRAHRSLDHGNPNLDNIRRDFNRFGFSLDLQATDPANAARLHHLKEMNLWRNIAAHQSVVPPGGLPSLSELRAWVGPCDGLATSLDGIIYNQLRRILRRSSWPP